MSGSDFSGSDGSLAQTRCSPQHVASVVKKFCALKRRLVTEIGFKGMLKVPEIGNLDRRFTYSLLNKVDIRRKGIKLSEARFIGITDQDVHHYLDIPNGPKKLFGLVDTSASEKMDFIRFVIGSSKFDIDEKNSLKAAEEIVTAEYPDGMTETQQEQFKVSFVCFSMGNFLTAKYSTNHGIKDYWGSLMNVLDISSFNFCQAVVDEILEAAKHVQKEQKANRPIKNLSGCHLFLQAKFFDSINLGELNITHNPFPRIEAFTSDLLLQMKNAIRQNYIKGQTKNTVALENKDECSNDKLHAEKVINVTEPRAQVCPYVVSAKKHASTEFLAQYTRVEAEKRLNDKQLADLRLHNAHIKLFINNFKKKTLSDFDSSAMGKESCKTIFGSNVDQLMEDALGQVLVLSKSLHEHQPICNPSPSVPPTPDFQCGQQMTIYDPTIEYAPFKRSKKRNLPDGCASITGKNLIHDLTEADAMTTESTTPSEIGPNDSIIIPNFTLAQPYETPGKQGGMLLLEGLTTPISNISKGKMIKEIPEFTSIPCATLEFPKMMCTEPNDDQNYTTPKPLLKLLPPSPLTNSLAPDLDNFDEIMEVDASIDLNETPVGSDTIFSPIAKFISKKGKMARNPWFYGAVRHSADQVDIDKFHQWLTGTQAACLDSLWVNHSTPKMINVYGNDFKSVFTKGFNFTRDLFDLAIRRYGQMDRNMYGADKNLRWMHPFESDFSRRVLNDEDYLHSRSVRYQLTGKTQEYDISNCRMITIPHIINDTWVAYFWDMKEEIVLVADPTYDVCMADQLHELHAPIVNIIQDAMHKCFSTAYDGWNFDRGPWNKLFVQPFLPGMSRNESGLLTLLAIRNYNGKKFQIPQNEVQMKKFEKELLYNVLNIEGNKGSLPEVFVQSID